MDSNLRDWDHSSGKCLVPGHLAEVFPTENKGAKGKQAPPGTSIASMWPSHVKFFLPRKYCKNSNGLCWILFVCFCRLVGL